MEFKEDLLQYAWQFRAFNHAQLQTAGGQVLKILHPGALNRDSGPDFSTAKILIDGTEWIGNVEIHLLASDWLLHQHQNDPAYNNVILHVVYKNDVQVHRPDGSPMPVLVLEDRISSTLVAHYTHLLTAPHFFPCAAQIRGIDPLIVVNQLSRTLTERLEAKTKSIHAHLEGLKGDWEETLYHLLAKNFGFKVNALPFELLARSLPKNILAKHKGQALQLEALIFGQAGFLQQPLKDPYPAALKKEYRFLRQKYKLHPLDRANWKFMRMRPQNFPTLRIAQFAGLMHKADSLFTTIMEEKNNAHLFRLFQGLPVNSYWRSHYHFSKPAVPAAIQPGKTAVENIMINTIAPFLFAYGKYTDQQPLVNRALDLLEAIPPEANAIVKPYAAAGIPVSNAFQSQAILQLNKYYCNPKKCLSCAVGMKILKREYLH